MNILMMTNTFSPHVGGVARSVTSFMEAYRRAGHRCVVVAPEFEGADHDEVDVVRVPAIQNFNGSDFSVRLPIPGMLSAALNGFRPDIVHSHHPFLLGDTALRLAHAHSVPLVFTHHTLYEQYTHYVPGDSPALKRFVVELSTGYANLCDRVLAPSESVARLLWDRGVTAPVDVVPTGVPVDFFASGRGRAFRRERRIPERAYLIGHSGRLAPEKNLAFLVEAVCAFLKKEGSARFAVVGAGPMAREIADRFRRQGLGNRLAMTGTLQGQALADAYAAMNVFAFASRSETQGLVVAEAMAAGVPVVALDAPGVREVVRDRENGRLLAGENVEKFSSGLRWGAAVPHGGEMLRAAARETAAKFSVEACAGKALRVYGELAGAGRVHRDSEDSVWSEALRWIKTEWDLVANLAEATTAAVSSRRGARARRILQ